MGIDPASRPFPHQGKSPLPKDAAQLLPGYLEATRQYISLLVKAKRGGVMESLSPVVAGRLEALSFWIRKRGEFKTTKPGVLETLPRLVITNQNKGLKHDYIKCSAT
jgi:hypothetical protein